MNNEKGINSAQEYLERNFTLSNCGPQLVGNILQYVAGQGFADREDVKAHLGMLLDGVGLTSEELDSVVDYIM